MHDIEIPAQKQPQWIKVPLFSKHPAPQNWCFDYETNNKLQRMTTQIVHNKFYLC